MEIIGIQNVPNYQKILKGCETHHWNFSRLRKHFGVRSTNPELHEGFDECSLWPAGYSAWFVFWTLWSHHTNSIRCHDQYNGWTVSFILIVLSWLRNISHLCPFVLPPPPSGLCWLPDAFHLCLVSSCIEDLKVASVRLSPYSWLQEVSCVCSSCIVFYLKYLIVFVAFWLLSHFTFLLL